MERSFLFASEYGFIVSQAAEFVTKRRKKAPGAGALRGRKIRVYFAAISAAAAVQRSVIGLPPLRSRVHHARNALFCAHGRKMRSFSDFVPELLKITQFYHFFMLK